MKKFLTTFFYNDFYNDFIKKCGFRLIGDDFIIVNL